MDSKRVGRLANLAASRRRAVEAELLEISRRLTDAGDQRTSLERAWWDALIATARMLSRGVSADRLVQAAQQRQVLSVLRSESAETVRKVQLQREQARERWHAAYRRERAWDALEEKLAARLMVSRSRREQQRADELTTLRSPRSRP